MSRAAATARALRATRLLAILRGDAAASSPAAHARREAMLAGGLSCWEVSLTTPGALARMRALADEHGERALVGAGTVLDEAQAQAAIDAGAPLLVAPSFSAAVAVLAHRRDVLYLPGVMTPTEAVAALEHGCELVKLFPAAQLGPAYVRALLRPLPRLAVVAVGGVDVENARAFLDAGAVALGLGGSLLDVDAARVAQRLRALRERCGDELPVLDSTG